MAEIAYKLKIEAFSPETIPMERLGEYMVQFGKLLGNVGSVHFRGLEDGSTVLKAGVQFEDAPKVKARLHSVKLAEATNDVVETVGRLNVMLREDNASARILSATAANDNDFSEELYLPGREVPVAEEIGPFNEPASIKAKLFRIGGRDETAHAQLIDSAGRIWNGKLTQSQATAMGDNSGLYKWFQVDGTARWLRGENGEWQLKDFHIRDFRRLPEDSLTKDIESLRAIKGNKWGDAENPDGLISEMRRDDDGVH